MHETVTVAGNSERRDGFPADSVAHGSASTSRLTSLGECLGSRAGAVRVACTGRKQ